MTLGPMVAALLVLLIPSVAAFVQHMAPHRIPAKMMMMLPRMSCAEVVVLKPTPAEVPSKAKKAAERELRVGVIGAGRIGEVHLSTLAVVDGVRPVIVSDINGTVLRRTMEKYRVEQFTLDPMEVINHPEVDAVWICSPSQFHEDQIKACAKARKHIFCEKPISPSLEGAANIVKLVRSSGIQFMTAFNRRYDPNFLCMHQMLAAGEIGRPLQAVLQSRDSSPPPLSYVQGGGGLFKDMCIHDLDVATWMMSARGSNKPLRVYATGTCAVDMELLKLKEGNPSEAIDTANILVEFESGSTTTIQVCRKATYGYDQRAEVFGENGLLKHENIFPSQVQKWDGDSVKQADLPHDFFMTRYKNAYIKETQAFCESLLMGKEPSPSANDGLQALVLVCACDKSLQEGRPVEVSEIVVP